MNRMDYGRSVVTVRVLEKRLLTKNKLERMIEAETPDEVLKLLGETEYSQNMTDIDNSRDYEKILKRETERVFSLVRDMSKDSEIVDILSLKYDYHNLKVLLRGRMAGKEFVSVISEAEKDFSENKDPQRIDIISDKYYYSHLLRIANSIDTEILRDYVQGLIDFQNIITLLRVKKQNRDFKFLENVIHDGGKISGEKIISSLNDSPEGIVNKFKKEKIGVYLSKGMEAFSESGRLSELEKIADNYLLELNKESKYIVFGPEPLFTYLVAKEREINAVRMIMVSKINNINSEKVKERLRDTYA